MIKNPFFSIIIPVYNVENYIHSCLDSLLHQTFGDFEVLCVCDVSNDASVRITNEYCQQDERFHFLEGESKGLSAARNLGISASTGDYICFLDSDDYFAVKALEVLHQEISRKTPDVLVFGAVAFPKKPRPQRWLRRTLSSNNCNYNSSGVSCLFENHNAMPFVWRNCFKHTFLNQHTIRFDEALRVAEDVAFQMDAFCRANRIRFISNKLYFYQWYRENSLQHQYSQNSYIRLLGHLQVVDHVISHWTEFGILHENRFLLATWVLSFLFGYDLRNLPSQQRQKMEQNVIEKIQSLLGNEELAMLPFFTRAQYNALKNDDFSLGGFIGKIRYHLSKLHAQKKY